MKILKKFLYKIPPIAKYRKIVTDLESTNQTLQHQAASLLHQKEVLQGDYDGLMNHHKELLSAHDSLAKSCGAHPPGHFYSPIASIPEIERDEELIFGKIESSIPGIDMNEAEQLRLLETFAPFHDEMPFEKKKTDGLRFFYQNPAYSYSDAIVLHCMIRHLKPKRVIEIGSGFSSCMTLDTDELFLNSSIDFTCIEPYPELLLSLVKDKDKNGIKILSG